MSDTLAQIRLLQCADSAFPSGNFAFSNGLETLVAEGRVRGAADITGLLKDQILPRWLSFDRWFVVEAHKAASEFETGDLVEIDRACHAQSTTENLAAASRRVGQAMLRVHERLGTPLAADFFAAIGKREGTETSGYEPVVQGLVGAGVGLDLSQTEVGAIHTLLTGTVSAAVRLGRLGALDAQTVLAAIAADASTGLLAPLPDHPHSFAPLAEIATQRPPPGNISLFAT